MFDLNLFIEKHITGREKSLFLEDVQAHQDELLTGIADRSVLVIGGAGSIGTAFIKSIIPYKPAEIIVVDINENALTELVRSVRSDVLFCKCIPRTFLTYAMDYFSNTFHRLFVQHKGLNHRIGFDIVANFSAHKHVRSEKDKYSVEALLRNNVINAKGLLDLLEKYPPDVYFCVSTDKAANPVNIMGASKRIMEDLIFSYSDSFPVKTSRFANVAFSNGSLPCGFLNRINALQPISAPVDVKRFFVSSEESGQICMISAILGNNRDILFPKLADDTMRTFDRIAENLLHEYGFKVLKCHSDEEAIARTCELRKGSLMYPVHFDVSDTNGEKGFEEFYTREEHVEMDRFKALGVITGKPKPDKNELKKLISSLEDAFEVDASKEDIVNILEFYLPNFKHVERGRNLDTKM